jgi:hypothetical protein
MRVIKAGDLETALPSLPHDSHDLCRCDGIAIPGRVQRDVGGANDVDDGPSIDARGA